MREETGEQHGRRPERGVTTGVHELPQNEDGHLVGQRFTVDLGGREHTHDVPPGVGSAAPRAWW